MTAEQLVVQRQRTYRTDGRKPEMEVKLPVTRPLHLHVEHLWSALTSSLIDVASDFIS